MSVDVFGKIVDAGLIERAVRDTIDAWLPTYLREVERQNDLDADSLEHVRSFVRTSEFEKPTEDQIPCCLIICPGTLDRPLKEGQGTHRARWVVGIGVIASARDAEATMDLAKLYSAAIRALLVQQSSLGIRAKAVDWEDERYDDLPSEDQRTLGVGRVVVTVEMHDVVTGGIGPEEPSEDPPDWPAVEEVDVELEPEVAP